MAFSHATVPDAHVMVLLGALGDLSRRKLLPGLFRLSSAGSMPDRYRIIGTSRRGGSAESFREVARQAVGDAAAGDDWERFAERLSFSAFRADEPEPLVEAVAAAQAELGDDCRRLHYLSIPPGAFEATVRALGASGLADDARVVLEKPFGVDLESARRLNELVPGSSPRTACSGSTTSSAARRSRTSSPCASPMACSNRSGTGITSTMCRSTSPRRCPSSTAPTSTRPPAPTGTWW